MFTGMTQYSSPRQPRMRRPSNEVRLPTPLSTPLGSTDDLLASMDSRYLHTTQKHSHAHTMHRSHCMHTSHITLHAHTPYITHTHTHAHTTYHTHTRMHTPHITHTHACTYTIYISYMLKAHTLTHHITV